MVGLGVGPPCLRVDSEETLLTVMDERVQLARAAPGVTPVDSSEERAPVPELIKLSVLGEPLVDSKFERLGRCHSDPAAAFSSGWRCTQRRFAGSGVSACGARIFDKVVIRSLQRSRALGRIQSVSFSERSGVQGMIHRFLLLNWKR